MLNAPGHYRYAVWDRSACKNQMNIGARSSSLDVWNLLIKGLELPCHMTMAGKWQLGGLLWIKRIDLTED
jgi:hypothetical protein